jgi:hypothetical protein
MRFNPLDYPIALSEPARIAPSQWMEHVPFGMTLVALTRPRLLVELGTFAGVSYCGFCQAIASLELDCRAFAVDTWHGDPQSGGCDPEVFAELSRYHDSAYGSFSTLLKSTFDDALGQFADGSIDLLHLDGLHTYEAACHDFHAWLPKLSRRAVVVLHDIGVRHGDFGVWRLWDEIREVYPNFEFVHQHGLGIAAVGPDVPAELRVLFELDPAERRVLRNFYCQLGRRLTFHFQRDRIQAEWAEFRTQEMGRYRDLEQGLRDRLAGQEWMLSQMVGQVERLNVAAEAQAAAAAAKRSPNRWTHWLGFVQRAFGTLFREGPAAFLRKARRRLTRPATEGC